MDKKEKIIKGIRDIFIEMYKGTVYNDNIDMYCDKHKQFYTEMDNIYRYMGTIQITDMIISKTKYHSCKTMLLWRELKLPVTSSAPLFEDHIVYQMENIVGGLADKSENNIEKALQDGKRSEPIYCGLINFEKSQVSQLKNNGMMTNLQVKLKSEQIKNESKRNRKRKR